MAGRTWWEQDPEAAKEEPWDSNVTDPNRLTRPPKPGEIVVVVKGPNVWKDQIGIVFWVGGSGYKAHRPGSRVGIRTSGRYKQRGPHQIWLDVIWADFRQLRYADDDDIAAARAEQSSYEE